MEKPVPVVILCGGQGTRIRDVADDIPKPMIPLGSRPILWHIMKGYAQHGCTDFILCLGYKSWSIKSFFLNYHLAGADFSIDLGKPAQVQAHAPPSQENWHVTLAETGLSSMTGCRVKRIEKYLTGDTFLLTYGDGVADVDVDKLVRFHRRHGKIATVTAVRRPGPFRRNRDRRLPRGRVHGKTADGAGTHQRRILRLRPPHFRAPAGRSQAGSGKRAADEPGRRGPTDGLRPRRLLASHG